MKTFSELNSIESFKDRVKYLFIGNKVCDETFGGRRYINQRLYHSKEWMRFRRDYIVGMNMKYGAVFDLAHKDYPLKGQIILHHIDPLTAEDIMYMRDKVFSHENIVACSYDVHNYIHYGGDLDSLIRKEYKERTLNDTCPWRNNEQYAKYFNT